MQLMPSLVPAVTACEEVFEHRPELPLFPEEVAFVAGAVEKRRREFATVRECARRSLARIGHPPVPLLPGERGAPVWPAGLVGRMTHCEGYAAAAIGRASDVHALGIDAEPHAPLPAGVLDMIALPGERCQLDDLHAHRDGIRWDRLLFSAKESVYKCWFPMMGTWLGFEDAEVTFDPSHRTFSTRLRPTGPVIEGRWTVGAGLVATAARVDG
jgi:4'-phosphopantetheinyl transferase EntD